MKRIVRKLLSETVFCVGVIVITVLAVPAAILAGLIYAVWIGTDSLLKALE